jgi:hypothetical protein
MTEAEREQAIQAWLKRFLPSAIGTEAELTLNEIIDRALEHCHCARESDVG